VNHDEIIIKPATNNDTFYIIRRFGHRNIGMIGLDSNKRWWAAGAGVQKNFDYSFDAINALIESDDRFLETLERGE
jgi:hypothetical protein